MALSEGSFKGGSQPLKQGEQVMSKQKWLTTAAGVKMPPMIYGTAWKKEQTADLVKQALVAGFRGIDTACQPRHYNEALVGQAVKDLKNQGIDRSDIYLQTKYTPPGGQDPENTPYDRKAPIEEQVAQSFEVSKNNLQTDSIDSLVLHSPLSSHHNTMTAWRAMEEIYRSGAARQLGISNCYDLDTLRALYQEAAVKPVVLQNRFYAQTGYDRELRDWCMKNNIIYQSFWTLTANPHLLESRVVTSLAEKHQKTAPQIVFRYLTQRGIVPLTGTTSEQHMKEDLDIFEFDLDAEDAKQIDDAFSAGFDSTS